MNLRKMIPCVLALGLLAGCSSKTQAPTGRSASALQFVDVTAPSGITWKHNSGAFGLKFTPETMGSGVAFIDANGDGFQDIFLVNSRDWTNEEILAYKNGNGKKHLKEHGFVVPPRPAHRRTTGALYQNNGDGTFTDVTRQAGLDVEMFGMGAAVGDYDNDGKPDLYVTGYGRNYLFHNETIGKTGKFREATSAAGVQDGGWSASAAWVDYDRDGKLDLFVSHYFKWTPATDAYRVNAGPKIYTGPDHYSGDVANLYHNEGNGRFKNVSEQAGIHSQPATKHQPARPLLSKALGVAICDFNNDLWPDIAVANDRVANQFFQNNKNGTFAEIGVQSGIAYDAAGQARAGMGIDAADLDHSNRESLAITNFSSEMLGLYWNTGKNLFVDIATDSAIGQASLPFVGFGTAFTDFDLDGWPDLIVTNGDVFDDSPDVERDPSKPYAQRMVLFHNQGPSRPTGDNTVQKPVSFEETTAESGDALMKPLVGRGLACSDFDLDGDLDVLVTTNGGSPLLLRNDGGNSNHAIRVELRGTKSNRSAIGAVVWGVVGNDAVRRVVHSGSSYMSQSELPITLGLGSATQAKIMIRWPSEKLMELKDVKANQIIFVDEDKGIVRQQMLRRK